MSLHFKVLAS